MKKIAISLLLILMCSNAFSDVKVLIFDKNNVEKIHETIRKSKDLTGEEVELFLGALMRSSFKGNSDSFIGKTVGQVINEQRVYMTNVNKEEKLAKEKEKKEIEDASNKLIEKTIKEMEITDKLAKYISIIPTKKGFQKGSYDSGDINDKITLSITFENKSKKAIKAFKSKIIFKNLFNEVVYTTYITYEDGLAVDEKKEWDGAIKYNMFDDEKVTFKNAELDKLKSESIIRTILFEDGSKIGVDD